MNQCRRQQEQPRQLLSQSRAHSPFWQRPVGFFTGRATAPACSFVSSSARLAALHMQVAVAAAAQEQEQAADVYEFEPQPLEEGVRKHMLSVFVADESGLINRVAGVFARRGANIESLAVGLTVDKALFTIVATGTDAVVANLAKQIGKLVNVRYVEDITDESHVERELMLIKVRGCEGVCRCLDVCVLALRILLLADRTGLHVAGWLDSSCGRRPCVFLWWPDMHDWSTGQELVQQQWRRAGFAA